MDETLDSNGLPFDADMLPRLSKSLRSFCSLTNAYKRKQGLVSRPINAASVSSKHYREFKKECFKLIRGAQSDLSQMQQAFETLEENATQLLRNETSHGTLEEACSTLLRIFRKDEKDGESQREDCVSSTQTTEIHRYFGPFSVSVCNKAFQSVEKIRVMVGSVMFDHAVDTKLGSKKVEFAEAKRFGNAVPFNNPRPDRIIDFGAVDDRLFTLFKSDQNSGTVGPLSCIAEPLSLNGASSSAAQIDSQPQSISAVACTSSASGFTLDVLRIELAQSFDDHESVLSAITNSLASSSGAAENDLVELLGYEKLDLIELILQHRLELVQDFKRSSSNNLITEGSQFATARLVQRKRNPPAYGQQITIQSETEVALAKQLRKEGKRIARQHLGADDLANDDFADIEQLRQRELDLEALKNVPLFGRELEPVVTAAHKYPFVFDRYTEAKRSAAFIAGCKMSLPADIKRYDCKQYEEISLPAAPAASTDIGKDRIKISSLDEIAKKAFVGTEELNRIQSVVFRSAYKSNENLLICAPTGAGKTNIAMLCILREINQNFVNKVLRKEQFKIIYVAPMKALAAEMVSNFGKRLSHLDIAVKELTGDMQLTKQEILSTQMLVTTPEKWDVVTRKGTGDASLSQAVKLIIIDEIHLLHDDRGPVIETIVARTLRQAEHQQTMIRIVGLSATLPNYVDVAQFLRVNMNSGMFFFDDRFRPVPLGQRFIGIKTEKALEQQQEMDLVCYDKVLEFVKKGYQAMVFVHARNATGRVAGSLRNLATSKGDSLLFQPPDSASYGLAQKAVGKSRNYQLRDLFTFGFAIHHAGMLRSDRTMVEKLFRDGHIRVLVCTSTLAWGVNLPAHAVIIRGTEVYDAKRGTFVDLSILDVQQIFGRAGRPQYDTEGHGTIITTHDRLAHYLSVLTRQRPIESQLIDHLADCLNAEISLGTVSTIDEAIEWLSYTFLYVRMRLNPLAYGVTFKEAQVDAGLTKFRRQLVEQKATQLMENRMVRYVEREGLLFPTDLGRTASNFYIKCDTIEVVNKYLDTAISDEHIVNLICKASEFDQIKVRDDELDELDKLHHSGHLPVQGGVEQSFGKVNVLLQAHVSRISPTSFSLISDSSYVVQQSQRILRGLLEIAFHKNSSPLAGRLLTVCRSVELQLWPQQHALFQFCPRELSFDLVEKIQDRKLSVDYIKESNAKELGAMLQMPAVGYKIIDAAKKLPALIIEPSVQPLTSTVLKVTLTVTPDFTWDEKWHGKSVESFWIWVEDPESYYMHHCEFFLLHKKQVKMRTPQNLTFAIPIRDDQPPTQYLIRCCPDRWFGVDLTIPLPFQHLILPSQFAKSTELLDLQPLPISVLQNDCLQGLYKFTHFNAVQTQIFFCLYHTDKNVLLGAPTGSGKTVAAELAFFRVFREYPNRKCVYIAPLKALVRERMIDWKDKLENRLGKRVVELTGDVTPDVRAIASADVIVTTPEKWDGISRSWQTRSYVRDVGLLVVDEIHLLGGDRGPVLEVVVSRMNFIRQHTRQDVRIVGLSTALASAEELAGWLGVDPMGLYNFKPSVRPVPMSVHIQSFPAKHYCPRMASMNKPVFQAIKQYSEGKPVLIFVSSRRQTRLTALDLIAFLAAETDPQIWVNMNKSELDYLSDDVLDSNLKLSLAFGIGLHHAGLQENDRKIVEYLFVNQKIQVLIATATLAWGVNFPAHLVIVKGTEYFDGKARRYVDFPITDVLQMMGRAGRPQFDDSAVAVIMVQDVKKSFYKKFLYEPFPVESSLVEVLPEHLNAEIVASTIKSKQEALEYLSWTYLYRRLLLNPTYYNLESTEPAVLNKFMSAVVDKAIYELVNSYCVEILEDERTVNALTLGRIASFYYLNHRTVKLFRDRMSANFSIYDVLLLLTDAAEYDEIPVRHNEDLLNAIAVESGSYDSPHTKAHLLFQAHFGRLTLPCTDYLTDLKTVLDNAIRILQAMLDVAADAGFLATTLTVIQMIQMVVQARWIDDPSTCTLPHITPSIAFKESAFLLLKSIPHLWTALSKDSSCLLRYCSGLLGPSEISDIQKVLSILPRLKVSVSLEGCWRDQDGKISQATTKLPGRSSTFNRVFSGQEYVLNVDLENLVEAKDKRAHAPKFPKAKEPGWILIIGDTENRDLIALRRVGPTKRTSTKLVFTVPVEVNKRVIYTLYIMSDSYIGLDQQFDLRLETVPNLADVQHFTDVE